MSLENNKNWDTLKSFISYCVEHPEQRFWQALRNWAGVSFVLVSTFGKVEDTFSREGK